MKFILFFCGLITLATSALLAKPPEPAAGWPALKNAVILIIRHAEKPDSGDGLSAVGEARAGRYVDYFKTFAVESTRLKLDYIFAAMDSNASRRPRLTVTPLSKASGVAIDSRFKDKQFQELANEIHSRPHGQGILICWHHGSIADLTGALGANFDQVVPKSKWPDSVYNWVIQLRYDENGKLIEAKCINENLMPGDSEKHEKL